MDNIILFTVILLSIIVCCCLKIYCSTNNIPRQPNEIYSNIENINPIIEDSNSLEDIFVESRNIEMINNNTLLYNSEKKDINCIICLDDIEEGDSVRSLRCLHKFHQKCIDEWLQKQKGNNLICPICETKIINDDNSDILIV